MANAKYSNYFIETNLLRKTADVFTFLANFQLSEQLRTTFIAPGYFKWDRFYEMLFE